MSITFRLVLAFLAVAMVPVLLVSYLGQRAMTEIGLLAVDKSSSALKAAGEESIRQKARDVARQVELYVEISSAEKPTDLLADLGFAALAVQHVGKTGYTVVWEARSGVVLAHPNSALAGHSMRELASTLPSFWSVFSRSLDGSEAAGYYDWRESDGSMRKKFMANAPVQRAIDGTVLIVSATTYLDEFHELVRDTGAKINERVSATQQGMATIVVVAAVVVLLLAFGLSHGLTSPLRELTTAVRQVQKGRLDCSVPVRGRDELAILAGGLNAMLTSLRDSRQALAEHAATLEQRVAERTAELERLALEAQAARAAVEEANARLKASELNFSQIVSRALVGVFRTTADGQVQEANPALLKILRCASVEEMNRIGLSRIYARPDRKRLIALLEEGPVTDFQTEFRRGDGRIVPISLSAQIVRDKSGAVQYLEGTCEDITERQRAHKQLVAAHRAAESANQAKSAFLAMMSHEIRTPMNAIIGMTSLLLGQDLSPGQRKYAETIRHSGEALLTILNDILDFSKIEAGKLELSRQPFDVRACTESCLDLLACRAREKGLELGLIIDGRTPATIIGDSNRLHQILVNLIGNAIKFTEKGEVIVRVTPRTMASVVTPTRTKGTGRRGLVLHFAISDTGIGIPADRMWRLFQSFSQVDSSTTRRYGGTGLGLAISKRLTEMMGGTIWVDSEVGKGTTFHFTLQTEALPEAQPSYLRLEQPLLAGKRVLIVAENPVNRQILTLQSKLWGMEPVIAEGGEAALALLARGERFAVALLDLAMPGMDGIELNERLRQRCADVLPTILLSSTGEFPPGAGSGFRAVVGKPVKASRLYDAFMQVLHPATAEIQRETAQPEVPGLDAELGRKHPLTLLLVEDNSANQQVALSLLEGLGYRADVAANGKEAIEALQRQTYDAVLMDVQMPVMDGLEATRKIRAALKSEAQPFVVAMTANAMEGDREECLEAGMDAYLSKPIRIEELVVALQRCGPLGSRATGPIVPAGTPTPVSVPAAQPLASGRTPCTEVIEAAALARLVRTLGRRAPEVLPRLFADFCASGPKLLAEAHEALVAHDAAALRRAAHTLKSVGSNFGGVALTAIARQVEQMARRGELDGVQALLQSAEAAFATARMEIEKRLESLRSSLG